MPRRAEAPTRLLNVRLSPAERAIAERAARVNHQNVSQFLRDALLTAAEDCLELRRRSHALVVNLDDESRRRP